MNIKIIIISDNVKFVEKQQPQTTLITEKGEDESDMFSKLQPLCCNDGINKHLDILSPLNLYVDFDTFGTVHQTGKVELIVWTELPSVVT